MDLYKSIAFLLGYANPSIKKRVQSEILNCLTYDEVVEYEKQILLEPNIKRCISSQLENGWFGYGFHGTNKNSGQFENQETCTKYLGEKSIDKSNHALKRSMEAFINIPLDDLCYRTKGKLFSEFQYAANGQNLIRCACIARCGYDDIIDINPQIQLALDSFKRVLEVDSIVDIARHRKGKPTKSNPSGIYYLFNDYEKWPCRYHLDILAHTKSWKTEENIEMLAKSIEKMMRTDKPELIGLIANSWVGYSLGTLGCFPSQGLSVKTSCLLPSPILMQNSESSVAYHMEYIEWFARCGVIDYIPLLKDAVNEIVNSIDDKGICRINVLEEIFMNWGPYAGLQLETDWKTETKRNCDITFRALLIAYYAGILARGN